MKWYSEWYQYPHLFQLSLSRWDLHLEITPSAFSPTQSIGGYYNLDYNNQTKLLLYLEGYFQDFSFRFKMQVHENITFSCIEVQNRGLPHTVYNKRGSKTELPPEEPVRLLLASVKCLVQTGNWSLLPVTLENKWFKL